MKHMMENCVHVKCIVGHDEWSLVSMFITTQHFGHNVIIGRLQNKVWLTCTPCFPSLRYHCLTSSYNSSWRIKLTTERFLAFEMRWMCEFTECLTALYWNTITACLEDNRNNGFPTCKAIRAQGGHISFYVLVGNSMAIDATSGNSKH